MSDRLAILEHEIQTLRERITALENGNADSIAMIMGTFDLTLTQANILAHLLKRNHCTRQMMLDAVWGLNSEPPTHNTLHVHIFNIRAKMREHGVTIPRFQGETLSLAAATRRQISQKMTGNYTSNIHVVEIRSTLAPS